jgi:hypothetical protein
MLTLPTASARSREILGKIIVFSLLILLVPISSHEPTPFRQKLAATSSASPTLHVGDTWYYLYSGPEGNSREQIVRPDACGPSPCLVDQETNTAWNDTAWIRDWNLSRESYVDHTTPYNYSSVYTPPLHLYNLPLTVGESWWWNSTATGWYTDQSGNHTQTPISFSIKRTVVNQTTVTVPAGTFDTFLVAQYISDGMQLNEYRWFSLQAKTTVKLMIFSVPTGALFDSYVMTSYSLATIQPKLSINSLSPNPARPGQSVRLDYTATEAYGNVTATWVDWGDNSTPDLIFNMTSQSMCQRANPSLNSNNCTIPNNSLVLAQAQKDPSAIVNGSIIIFRPYPQEPAYLVMHRIIKVIPPSSPYGPYTFWTQGDANPSPDSWDYAGGITSNQVIGVYKSTLTPTGPGERYDTHAYPDQGNIPSRSYTIVVNATDENDSHAQTSISEAITQNSQPIPIPTPPPLQTAPLIPPFILLGAAAAVIIAISSAIILAVTTRKKHGRAI